jgi:hypothetical protein
VPLALAVVPLSLVLAVGPAPPPWADAVPPVLALSP